jgi:ribosomal protein L40E
MYDNSRACQYCNQRMPPNATACPACGKDNLADDSVCPVCNAHLEPGWVKCPSCGLSLEAIRWMRQGYHPGQLIQKKAKAKPPGNELCDS